MTGRRAGRLTLAAALGAALLPLPFATPPASAAAAAPLDLQLRRARHQLDAVVEEYNRIREELDATRAQLADLTPRLAPMREAVEQQRGKVGALAAGAYRIAAGYRVGILLGADDPAQFTDRLIVVTRLADNQQKAVAHLDQANHHYRKAQQALAALAAEQRKKHAQLRAKRVHVQGEIRRLRDLIDDAEARDALRAERRRRADLDVGPPPVVEGPAARAVRFAYGELDKPYALGGDGPRGYDASGFTLAAWRAAGRTLPHSTAGQRSLVPVVQRADLRPGDLVFYHRDLSHVAVYVGSGRIIHSPGYGETVRVDAIGYAEIHSYGRP
ncbi:C40 family peptidase [Pilimelia anulata]|uniref:C40 family peptidase n=1 Tax=Pilimelia anulata TaxID=53371 RepID=UPI00166544BF|nr:C40 family peptidase [Pilimelia anulata]